MCRENSAWASGSRKWAIRRCCGLDSPHDAIARKQPRPVSCCPLARTKVAKGMLAYRSPSGGCHAVVVECAHHRHRPIRTVRPHVGKRSASAHRAGSGRLSPVAGWRPFLIKDAGLGNGSAAAMHFVPGALIRTRNVSAPCSTAHSVTA